MNNGRRIRQHLRRLAHARQGVGHRLHRHHRHHPRRGMVAVAQRMELLRLGRGHGVDQRAAGRAHPELRQQEPRHQQRGVHPRRRPDGRQSGIGAQHHLQRQHLLERSQLRHQRLQLRRVHRRHQLPPPEPAEKRVVQTCERQQGVHHLARQLGQRRAQTMETGPRRPAHRARRRQLEHMEQLSRRLRRPQLGQNQLRRDQPASERPLPVRRLRAKPGRRLHTHRLAGHLHHATHASQGRSRQNRSQIRPDPHRPVRRLRQRVRRPTPARRRRLAGPHHRQLRRQTRAGPRQRHPGRHRRIPCTGASSHLRRRRGQRRPHRGVDAIQPDHHHLPAGRSNHHRPDAGRDPRHAAHARHRMDAEPSGRIQPDRRPDRTHRPGWDRHDGIRRHGPHLQAPYRQERPMADPSPHQRPARRLGRMEPTNIHPRGDTAKRHRHRPHHHHRHAIRHRMVGRRHHRSRPPERPHPQGRSRRLPDRPQRQRQKPDHRPVEIPARKRCRTHHRRHRPRRQHPHRHRQPRSDGLLHATSRTDRQRRHRRKQPQHHGHRHRRHPERRPAEDRMDGRDPPARRRRTDALVTPRRRTADHRPTPAAQPDDRLPHHGARRQRSGQRNHRHHDRHHGHVHAQLRQRRGRGHPHRRRLRHR